VDGTTEDWDASCKSSIRKSYAVHSMKEDAGRDAIGDKEPVCFPAVFALPSSSLVF